MVKVIKVKCSTCNSTYKIFDVNFTTKDCKNCPNGKVKQVS